MGCLVVKSVAVAPMRGATLNEELTSIQQYMEYKTVTKCVNCFMGKQGVMEFSTGTLTKHWESANSV